MRPLRCLMIGLLAGLIATWLTACAQSAGSDGGRKPSKGSTEPTRPKAVIFGDSWTVGEAAQPHTKGWAYVAAASLGWDAQVRGVSGTGYVRQHVHGTYLQRVFLSAEDPSVQFVVVQGGLNDLLEDLDGYAEVVDRTLEVFARKYPNAQIIVVGPALPTMHPAPANVAAIETIDEDLREVAAERGLGYVSPTTEKWLTPENIPQYIDRGALDHPNNAGHAYYASRFVADVLRLANLSTQGG